MVCCLFYLTLFHREETWYTPSLQLKIFKKALDLASWASNDKDMTHGKILNVMSTDVNQFHFMFYFVNFILVAPLQVGSESCVLTEHSNVQ